MKACKPDGLNFLRKFRGFFVNMLCLLPKALSLILMSFCLCYWFDSKREFSKSHKRSVSAGRDAELQSIFEKRQWDGLVTTADRLPRRNVDVSLMTQAPINTCKPTFKVGSHHSCTTILYHNGLASESLQVGKSF